MTLDEALEVLARLGPAAGTDWKAFRQARELAKGLVSSSPAVALTPRVDRLLAGLKASHDVYAQQALATGLARTTLALREPERFATSAAQATFRRPWLEGLLAVAREGVDVWPLVDALLRESVIPPNDLAMHLQQLIALSPETMLQRFEEIVALAPAVALKLVGELCTWKRLPMGPLVEPVLQLAEAAESPHQHEAVKTLSRDPGRFEPAQVARVEALIPRVGLATAVKLVDLLVTQLLRARRRADCDAWLDDVRPEVRRAAFTALVSRPTIPASELPRLLRGLRDDDSDLSDTAARALKEHLEARKTPPEDDELSLLLEHAGDARVTTLLSWLVALHPSLRAPMLARLPAGPLRDTLDARVTRACTQCRGIGRSKGWNNDWAEPADAKKLEHVAALSDDQQLLRCLECQAHFVRTYSVEYDVNSKHEFTSLTRLTFAALQAQYAQHVDLTHPRLASWNEALRADLAHVDPAVRADAEWELNQPK